MNVNTTCESPLQSSYGRTSLFLASMGGHVRVVEILLQLSHALYVSDHDGMDPVLIASSRGHVGVIEKLIEHDWDVSMPSDKLDRTAVHHAIMNDHADVLETLIVKGEAEWWEEEAVTDGLAQTMGSWRCLELMEVRDSILMYRCAVYLCRWLS